jgi:SPP1 gp7 family putative phage head morphogenesis protein
MATDPAHDATDEEIRRLSKRLHAAYSRAYMEMVEKARADLERQAEADREMAARVKAGEITADQLAAWRKGRAADAAWYAQMVDQLARDMAECDRQAAASVNGASPAVYAENANYGTFQVESMTGTDTSWTLVDADTVAGLVRDHPDLLPQVSPEPSKAEAWARRKVTSAIIQSVLVGESVPAAARRLRSVVDMGERAAVRAARTAITGAENAGRVSSYDRARGMGIDVRARWMATLDSRTRDSHRQLDGEVAGDDGRFSNGLRYPGDPAGPASEVWNCRCTLVASMPGADAFEDRNTSKLDTSYEDWKAGRDPKRPKPSGRSLREFMGTPAAERAAKKAGVSKAQLRRRIEARLGSDGRAGRDFPSMTRAEQQEVLSRAVGSGTHAAGSGASARWASQYANETMEIVPASGKAVHLEGDPLGVPVPDDVFPMLKGASVSHTHTTPIAGTFGTDDINLTVDGKVKSHEVHATLTGITYRLDRLPGCTDDMAEAFKRDFAAYDASTIDDLSYAFWQEHYQQAGVPMDDYDMIEVDKLLKPKLHEWLSEHAGEYGFRYTTREGQRL